MAAVSAWARNDPAKRRVKRIAHSDDKPYKPGGAARCHQRQQKAHAEERVDYVEDVIHDLRNSRECSRAFNFVLSVNDLINSFRTKFAGNLIYLLRLVRRLFRCGTGANFGFNVAFNLTLYRLVLCRPSGFIDR